MMILCKSIYVNFKKPTVIHLYRYNKLIYTIYCGVMKYVKLMWLRMLAAKSSRWASGIANINYTRWLLFWLSSRNQTWLHHNDGNFHCV